MKTNRQHSRMVCGNVVLSLFLALDDPCDEVAADARQALEEIGMSSAKVDRLIASACNLRRRKIELGGFTAQN